MAIALASSGTQPTGNLSPSVTITIAVDDILIAGYASDATGSSMSSYGSPLAQDVTNESTFDNQTFFAASGRATGSASSIVSTCSATACAVVAAFSGVDTTTQNDATPVSASSSSGVTSTGAMNITTATGGAMLALVVGVDGGTTDPTFSVSDGGAGLTWNYITSYESGGFRKLVIAYALKPSAGAIAVTGNFGLTAGFGACLYALKPAGGGGGSSPVLMGQAIF